MSDLISRQAAIYIASGYCHPANIAKELAKLPSAQPERRYTVRELSVFRHGISLSLCSKKSAQRWHYDEDTAIEIEFLERLYEKVGEDMRGCKDADDGIAVHEAIELLTNLPEIPDSWIPVSERLPEEGQKCLVCDNGWISIDTFVGHGNPYNWKLYVRDYEAWMPLPEPYRKEP